MALVSPGREEWCALGLFSRVKSPRVAQKRPAVTSERRSGKRVVLPLAVRIKVNEGEMREARVHDVNLPGIALEAGAPVQVGDRVSIGFDGYRDVAPPFALTGIVRRVLPGDDSRIGSAVGIEIDREATSADAMKNYRRVVLHYLHHKPLLEDINQGYFEARCQTCDWIGRVGRRRPYCSRCGSAVAPV